ncbi:MAG: tRNA uridine-5-carboxymethylaminomethyl(34) synthesis GTPase MnmE [Alcanivoracaceae bacterium]|nr:tRNA uridine-5-carboxymethylaminomethyl(34) synthesis GTPase MnmE [Alcanivoracaceae bacterium]
MTDTATDTDTIVAVATAPGRGGIGVIRLSGKEALPIARRMARPGLSAQPRVAHFTGFHDANGEEIDQGLLLYFPGPASFTGEDVVELQGHGGPVILDQLVREAVQLGARPARPGEFSLRAFLNDRMDLTQAEAIADLIDAGTAEAARAAMHSLQGAFSREVNTLVESLIALRMYVEAAIDFPEEEIDFLSDGKVVADLSALISQLERVLQEARQGQLLRDGMTVVIAGRPNAGKSSLLNQLAGHDAAIVTDIAGTTRDVLRESIQLDGMPLNVVDTAGLREAPDRVEQEGIRRAWREIRNADRLLVVADLAAVTDLDADLRTLLPDSDAELTELSVPVTLVLNKSDLVESAPQTDHLPWPCFPVSARSGDGLAALTDHLKQVAGYRDSDSSRFSARRRHLVALEEAASALANGQAQLAGHQAGELLAEDLRQAQKALEEITGAFSADDLLGRIFSSFCIGK